MLLLLLCPLFVACVKSQKSPLECDVRWFAFYYKLNDRTANMVHTHFAKISTRAGGEQEGEKVSLKRETPIDFRMTNWVERCGVVFCVVCNTKGSLSSRVEKLAHINTGFSQSSHNSFFFLCSVLFTFMLSAVLSYIRFFCNFLSFFLAHTDFLLFTLHFNIRLSLLSELFLFFLGAAVNFVSLVLSLPRLLLLSGLSIDFRVFGRFACWPKTSYTHNPELQHIHFTHFSGSREGKSQHDFKWTINKKNFKFLYCNPNKRTLEREKRLRKLEKEKKNEQEENRVCNEWQTSLQQLCRR